MTSRPQPLLGILMTASVIVVSLAFVSLFDWPTFRDWVSYCLVCGVPMLFVIGPFWHGEHPRSIAALAQPWRGLAYVGMTLATSALVALVVDSTIGDGITPPTPMAAHCVIIAVPLTFWMAVLWRGWPFNRIRNPVVGGVSLLACAYGLAMLIFETCFDYSSMSGAPFYTASLDPSGIFDAWSVVTFIVTCMAAGLLLLHVDLWPVARPNDDQPAWRVGVLSTSAVMAIAAAVLSIGTGLFGLAAAELLVRVTIPFLFGSIVVLNVLERRLFARHRQPARGALSAASAAVIGLALSGLYVLLAPTVTGDLAFGAPGFDGEVWLASALLAVTFPLLAVWTDCFSFWPLRRTAGRHEIDPSAGS